MTFARLADADCMFTRSITMWYKRHECGLRMAIFFSAATAAGAFGGLLARGIMQMNGIGGKGGWAWIFIIEGAATFFVGMLISIRSIDYSALTCVLATLAYFVMHDYPATASFLTSEEREEVLQRLEDDQSALDDRFDLKYIWHALKDWKIWVHMFITIGICTPLYSISLFLPTIVKTFTESAETAQLLTVPPYAVACIFCIGGGFVADRHRQRGIYMIGFCCVALAGFILLMATMNDKAKYLACFLITSGIYPNVPQGVAWNANNIGGSVKRGVGIAMHVGFGNLGGAIAGFIYRSQDSPRYLVGHGTLVGTITMSLCLSLFMTWWLRRENRRRDLAHRNPSHYSLEEKRAESDKGDHATFFRYTV
jgi:MFS family permease